MTKVYLGDTGTLVQLETGQSLAGATALSIEVQKPSGALTSWIGAAVGTKISFTSLVGTFDEAGMWLLQAHAVLPSGTWLGQTAKLRNIRWTSSRCFSVLGSTLTSRK